MTKTSLFLSHDDWRWYSGSCANRAADGQGDHASARSNGKERSHVETNDYLYDAQGNQEKDMKRLNKAAQKLLKNFPPKQRKNCRGTI